MRLSGVAWAMVIASAVLGAGGAAWPLVERQLPAPTPVTLGGWVPEPGADLADWLSRRSELEAEREVQLLHPEGALIAKRRDLGIGLDVEAALQSLGRPRPKPSTLARIRLALGGASTAPVDIAPSYRFDARRAGDWLTEIASGLRREPVDAKLDLPNKQRIEAQPGRELDRAVSLSRLAALAESDEVELAFTALAPKVPSSALADVDPSIVLSEYETDFAKRGGPRVKNIARAAAYLDGTLMAPGQVWSFNRTVGPRTLERGFVDAPVIVADELEPGVGGGVCQVASTLFAASVLGGLDVVQRRSHSRPSGYTPLGLDAAVIDGELDLQLRNPYPVSIIVHAYLPTPTTIRVEMLGIGAPGQIEHTYAVKKSDDFYRRVAKRAELRPDQVKRHQKGSPGYDVVSTVRTRYVDGSQRVRRYSSTYYPVPEIYWVGLEVDPDTLPPLPERATHTELTGEEEAAAMPASFTAP